MTRKRNFLILLITSVIINPYLLKSQNKNSASTPTISKSSSIPVSSNKSKLTEITSVEGITEYILSNGLKVLLFPDNSKPTATVNITYEVGSRNENYGETGMAHLLEHLMFKGSPKHPKVPGEFSTYGAQWNGSTWLDRTNYFETFPSNDKSIAWALDLESERMVHSFIAKKDLNSEMTVVRNEYESGENSPANILEERMQSTAFLWHNYGHSTIGARADIEKVPIERLQAFYRNYYQPDNAYLLVAGKFDTTQVKKLIIEDFGRIEKPKRIIQDTYTDEPTQDGERTVVLRRTGDVQVVGSLYHIPNGFHPDYAPLVLLMDILTDEPSGRLYKNLVGTKLATSVYGNPYALKEPGFTQFIVSVLKEKSLDSAKNILINTVEDFSKIPPTDEEVERMRTKELKNIELSLNSSDQIGIALSEFISQGDWRLFFLTRDAIKKVTKEDVLRVAKSYFKSSNRTLGEFYPTPTPDRANIPPSPVLSEILKDFKGGVRVSEGENFDPSPSNIDLRTLISKIGGVKLALLSKKTRGRSVQVNMNIHFGNPQTTANRGLIGNYTVSMLDKGSIHKTRQQIQDALDQLKAQFQISGDAVGLNISLETIHDKLPAVLELVSEILQTPKFPSDELEKLKLERIASLEKQRTDPNSLAYRLLESKRNPYNTNDYRYNFPLDEEIKGIKALNINDIQNYYKNVIGGSNMEIALVGEFSTDSVKSELTKLFSSWTSPNTYQRIPDILFPIAAFNEKIETPDKANAIFFTSLCLPIKDSDPDFPALKLGNYIFGEAQLSNRLANRIRQKEGISYGVGANLDASNKDAKTNLFAYAIYAPENLSKLETAYLEETKKAIDIGFTPAEVEDAKKGLLNNLAVDLATDNQLVGRLASNLEIDRTMQYTSDFESKIKALTTEEVNAAFRKYISMDKISMVKAGDFNKKSK